MVEPSRPSDSRPGSLSSTGFLDIIPCLRVETSLVRQAPGSWDLRNYDLINYTFNGRPGGRESYWFILVEECFERRFSLYAVESTPSLSPFLSVLIENFPEMVLMEPDFPFFVSETGNRCFTICKWGSPITDNE